jgi:hypothetical protein
MSWPSGLLIQRDGALVPGDDLPPQAVSVLRQTVRPGRITPGMLDLDDIGSPVAQQHGGDRGRVYRPKVEDPQARQRAGADRPLLVRRNVLLDNVFIAGDGHCYSLSSRLASVV